MRRFWKNVIRPIFEAENIRTVIEVGSDKGENTQKILHYVEQKNGVLYAVDPFPSFPSEEWEASSNGHFKMFRDLSLNVLDKIDPADAVLIDGDHNWFTVYNELMMIKKHYTKKFPLVFFHDICWPYDRRDLYYDPDNIPSQYKNKYKKAAIKVGSHELSEWGMNSHLYNAEEYGTEQNGVKTAVEDFLKDSPELGLKYYEFDVIHGLGMIASEKDFGKAIEIFNSADTCRKVISDAEQDRLRVQMLLEKARYDCRVLKQEIYSLKDSSYFMLKIYPDFGKGFSEDSAVKKEYLNGNVCETISFEKPPVRLRIDPAEKSYCVVSNLNVSTDKGILSVSSTNGVYIEDVCCFDTFDSMFIFDNHQKAAVFNISMNVAPFRSTDILNGFNKIRSELKEIERLSAELADAENVIAELTSEKHRTEDMLAQAAADKRNAENMLAQAAADKRNAEDMLAVTAAEKEKLMCEKISLKKALSNARADKEKNVKELEKRVRDADSKIISANKEIAYSNAIIKADQEIGEQLAASNRSVGWTYAARSLIKNGATATVCNIKGLKYIRNNGGFDLMMYCRKNPDVIPNMDPLLHYIWFGGYEGRDPSDKFSSSKYMNAYPDVAESGINPYVHYLLFGKDENRKCFADTSRNSGKKVIVQAPKALSASAAKTNTVVSNKVNEESSTVVHDAQKGFFLRAYCYSEIIDKIKELNDNVITIIVPIYNAYEETAECIESVIANTDFKYRLMLINDCSPDERIVPLLEKYKDDPNVEVVHNKENLGFVRTVNYGITHSSGDVVFLNSDTRVSKGWLTKLAVAAYHTDNIATVTPFSNAAGAFSVPVIGENKDIPDGFDLEIMNNVVEKSSRHDYVRVPTGNGFCMYVTRKAIDAVGILDFEAFSRGYGEENDFCMRAKNAGFINIIADDTYIYHKRSASFKEEKLKLIENNRKILDSRYPTYSREIKIFSNSEELRSCRSRIGEMVNTGDPAACGRKRILYVLHEGTGGTVKTNEDLMAFVDKNGYEVYMLTSNTAQMKLYAEKAGELHLLKTWTLSKRWNIADFYVNEYADIYFDVIFGLQIDLVHIRHLFKHSFDVMNIAELLNIPVAISFHDFYFICPTINLVNSDNKYCNAECRECDKQCRISSAMINIDAPVNEWVKNVWKPAVRKMISSAKCFITTSEYTRETYIKIYPEISDRFFVIEHGRDFGYSRDYRGAKPDSGKIRILLAGNIDVNKGGEYIERLIALDTENKLEFHCIGELIRETKDMLQDKIICHGKYRREQFADLVSEIKPAYIGIFSIWPETYCHVLSEAWSCGIPCIVSDIGTLKERAELHGGCIKADLDNAEKTYKEIIDVSYSDKYSELCAQVQKAKVHSISQMGCEYAILYHKLISASDRNSDALFWVNNFQSKKVGSSYIRVVSPVFNNPVLRGKMALIELNNAEDIPFYGETVRNINVLIQREKIDEDSIKFIEEMKEKNKISNVFFEIDDDLLSIDENHPQFSEYQNTKNKISSVKKFADHIISTNKRITERFSIPASIIPNYIDNAFWHISAPAESADKKEYKILFFGTVSHSNDLQILKKPMELLNKKLSDAGSSARLVVVGCTKKKDSWYDVLEVPSAAKEYPEFVKWLKANADFEIGVAPLELTNELNFAKSGLKYLEYAALGIPAVFTDIAPYQQVIRNGENGFLIKDNDPEMFAEVMSKLLTDAELRNRIAKAAYNDLLDNYMLYDHYEEIAEIFAGRRTEKD